MIHIFYIFCKAKYLKLFCVIPIFNIFSFEIKNTNIHNIFFQNRIIKCRLNHFQGITMTFSSADAISNCSSNWKPNFLKLSTKAAPSTNIRFVSRFFLFMSAIFQESQKQYWALCTNFNCNNS